MGTGEGGEGLFLPLCMHLGPVGGVGRLLSVLWGRLQEVSTISLHPLDSLYRRLREVAQGAEGGGAACRGRGEETRECGQGACSREGVQGAGEGRLCCRAQQSIQYFRELPCTFTSILPLYTLQ